MGKAVIGQDTFTARIAERFEDLDGARTLIEQYRARWTGGQFESLLSWDRPNEFTTSDLVAVSTLSVDVPPRAALWLLGDGREPVARLLEQVPVDTDIWTVEGRTALFGPLTELWSLLDHATWPSERTGGNGLGTAKKSKLIAAKRPRLTPIVDKVVKQALGPVQDYWSSFAAAFDDTDLRERVCRLCSEFHLSPLRIVDIVVWMSEQDSTSSRVR
jgi:hypothetical protein